MLSSLAFLLRSQGKGSPHIVRRSYSQISVSQSSIANKWGRHVQVDYKPEGKIASQQRSLRREQCLWKRLRSLHLRDDWHEGRRRTKRRKQVDHGRESRNKAWSTDGNHPKIVWSCLWRSSWPVYLCYTHDYDENGREDGGESYPCENSEFS